MCVLALGGVAHKPWRAFEAESHLRHAPATLEQLRFAIDAELAGARTFAHNHFRSNWRDGRSSACSARCSDWTVRDECHAEGGLDRCAIHA
jgi:hypothetical protein